jgi:tRNA pseudouridine38-40 synthase
VAIQPIIEGKVALFLGEEVSLIGSGRTDAGVHALAQAAHFKSAQPIERYKFLRSLNGMLPPDIRIQACAQVPMDFHAQYSALGKTYHYHLYLEEVLDPFRRLYCWHVRGRVDLEALIAASRNLVGTHDFTSFANESDEGSAGKDPVRTIKRLDIIPEKGGVRLEFEGDGFLYKMVRNITGTLIEIARGKREAGSIPALLAAKDRRLAGMAAPPQGLFLAEVFYDV